MAGELADDRIHALETLGNLNPSLHACIGFLNVVAKVRGHGRQWPGMQASPPRQRLPRFFELVKIERFFRLLGSIAEDPLAEIKREPPGTVDLSLCEAGPSHAIGPISAHERSLRCGGSDPMWPSTMS
jgi:hypothetical protein